MVNLIITVFQHSNYDLPACAPGRLALPVCHRQRFRRIPGGLDWRESLEWQARRSELP